MPTRLNIQENDTGATPASSLTLSSYTPSAGSNRVLEVMVAYGRTVTSTCAVTFGGVSMTSRGGHVVSGSVSVCVQAFTLNESAWPSTPANIVATLNGSGGIRIVASTITDVDQTTPMDATPVTYAPALNTNPWSIAIVTATADALVSAFGAGSDARTLSSIGAGQDQERLDTDVVEVQTVDITRTLLWEDAVVPSPGTVTMVATWNSGHARTAGVVLAYKPVVLGPTITVQPSADTVILTNENTATFSVTATGTGGLTYDWELETGVASGVYANLANGNGATWTGQTASSCTATLTAKTLSGRRVRCNVTDSNGTTTTNAVALTIYDGPQLTTFPATNGSGVSTATLTCDYPTGTGEAIEVRIPLSDGDVAVTVTTT